jgi:hypothetical protein
MLEKEFFKCRGCSEPIEVKTVPASAGHGTFSEEYEPVACVCGITYQSSEVAAMMEPA